MEADGQWIEFEGTQLLAWDAMGTPIDGVECARETEQGIEVMALAVTPEGSELVCSHDDGATFEPIRARMDIPGGMIVDLTEEE